MQQSDSQCEDIRVRVGIIVKRFERRFWVEFEGFPSMLNNVLKCASAIFKTKLCS